LKNWNLLFICNLDSPKFHFKSLASENSVHIIGHYRQSHLGISSPLHRTCEEPRACFIAPVADLLLTGWTCVAAYRLILVEIFMSEFALFLIFQTPASGSLFFYASIF